MQLGLSFAIANAISQHWVPIKGDRSHKRVLTQLATWDFARRDRPRGIGNADRWLGGLTLAV